MLTRLKKIGTAHSNYYVEHNGQLASGANSPSGGYGWSNQLARYLGYPDGSRGYEEHAKPFFHPNNVFTCPELPEGINNGNWPSYLANSYMGAASEGSAPSLIWPAHRIEDYQHPANKMFVVCGRLKDRALDYNFHVDETLILTSEKPIIALRHLKQTTMNFLDGHANVINAQALPQTYSPSEALRWLDKDSPPSPVY